MNKKAVTGIVLAGGASSRMGKDKGLCDFKGKPLVSYAIDILQPLCDNIIISSNNINDYQRFGLPVYEDIYKNIGPIGGIYTCLKKSSTIANLVVSCDTPFLISSVLKFVLENSDNYDVVAPKHGKSFYEPLAAYYSKSIVNLIEESINAKDYKLINFFDKIRFLGLNVGGIEGYTDSIFKNLNSPEDLI